MARATTPDTARPARVAVGIATKGRADVLSTTVRRLREQSRYPDRVVVCGTAPEDVRGLDAIEGVEILTSPVGLCRQRNTILRHVEDCDFILFLDDDFFLAQDYIDATLRAFERDPTVVVTTGHVVEDGVVGPGFTVDHGLAVIAADRGHQANDGLVPAWNGYGCNMALRLKPVRDHGLWFDERLPLYAWFEDVDFTRRLGRFGRIVKVLDARGVHLGVKSGRTSGRKLGYSQVANPIYLAAKGSYTWPRAAQSIGRHLLINTVKSAYPEPYVDRRGRFRGNAAALLDLVRGRLRPERILDL